jgi:hypothetical protein
MNEGLRGFIHHSNTHQVLQTLAQVIDDRSRIVLYGKPATGKGRLLQYLAEDYWRAECDAEREWHPIIYANHEELDWTAEVLRGSSAPTVARTLAAIMAEVQHIAERYRPDRSIRWQQKRRSIATKTQTFWLHNELYREFKTLRVRGLLIDNAQSIDYATLQALNQLWKRLQKERPFGLILAARLEKNEELDEPMGDMFKRAKIDPRDYEEPVVLQTISEEAFPYAALEGFFADLEVEFTPDLVPYEEFIAGVLWQRTQGDWKSIDQQAKKFNRLLGRRDGTLRRVTREVIEGVFGIKLPEIPPREDDV